MNDTFQLFQKSSAIFKSCHMAAWWHFRCQPGFIANFTEEHNTYACLDGESGNAAQSISQVQVMCTAISQRHFQMQPLWQMNFRN